MEAPLRPEHVPLSNEENPDWSGDAIMVQVVLALILRNRSTREYMVEHIVVWITYKLQQNLYWESAGIHFASILTRRSDGSSDLFQRNEGGEM